MPNVVIGGSSVQVVITKFGDTDLDGVLDPAVIAAFRGPAGPAGPPGAGEPVRFLQTSPAASWPIPHSLLHQPSVLLIVDGREVFADVNYPSTTLVSVTFPSPYSGEAFLF